MQGGRFVPPPCSFGLPRQIQPPRFKGIYVVASHQAYVLIAFLFNFPRMFFFFRSIAQLSHPNAAPADARLRKGAPSFCFY